MSDGRPTATQAAIQQPISQQPSTQLPNSTVVPRVAVTPPPAGIDPTAARKPQGLAGYVVREVYNGMALIEELSPERRAIYAELEARYGKKKPREG